jgi:hypothetical protein
MSACPEPAATCNAVKPEVSARFGSACASSSARTISGCPYSDALIKAVDPSRFAKSTFAPPAINACVISSDEGPEEEDAEYAIRPLAPISTSKRHPPAAAIRAGATLVVHVVRVRALTEQLTRFRDVAVECCGEELLAEVRLRRGGRSGEQRNEREQRDARHHGGPSPELHRDGA